MQTDNEENSPIKIANLSINILLPKLSVEIPPEGLEYHSSDKELHASISVKIGSPGGGVKAQILDSEHNVLQEGNSNNDGEIELYYENQQQHECTLKVTNTPNINIKSEVIIHGSNWQ